MRNNQDIRWVQRFENYQKAFKELSLESQEASTRDLSKLERKGVIKSFEIVYELAWKVLKDFLEEQGNSDIRGSKGAFKLALQTQILSAPVVKTLMESIEDSNQTTHTYDDEETNAIFHNIIESYHTAFQSIFEMLHKELKKIK